MREIAAGSCYDKDGWLTVKQHENGFPVVYQARRNMPDDVDIETLANMLCVMWRYDSDGDDGLPGKDVAGQLAAFEKVLASVLEDCDHSHLMLQITGKSKKEWLWYVRDPITWQEKVAGVVDGNEGYPVNIVCYDAQDWQIYKQIRKGMDSFLGKAR